MQIVIELDEDKYSFVKKQVSDGIDNPLKVCIANGIPLPEGHGDLIDRAELMKHEVWGTFGETGYDAPCVFRAYITGAPVIIPADNEEQE